MPEEAPLDVNPAVLVRSPVDPSVDGDWKALGGRGDPPHRKAC